MISKTVEVTVRQQIVDYSASILSDLVDKAGPYAIKFVQSQWAENYSTPQPLKISDTPAQTWGSATYVTPLAFPLSSALYGRVGLVVEFDPKNWRIFDATTPAGRYAYIIWARSQPAYSDLLLTVHSTQANHLLRNQFRETFQIDCVLFRPDQEADLHTDVTQHIWMAVTDWTTGGQIDTKFSQRLGQARFTVLLDEDFQLKDEGLPVRQSKRQIESVTEKIKNHHGISVDLARRDPSLPAAIAKVFTAGGYLHAYIVP